MANKVFGRSVRNAVASASDGGPSLGTWLDRIRSVGEPTLVEAIEGIWCGRSGRQVIDLDGSRSSLCVGWHEGRVEFSYLS